jgi:hypothetical protein
VIDKIVSVLKKYRIVLLLSASIFAVSGSLNAEGLDFDVPDLPSWVIDAGLKFINNPDDVFFNFHLDNVDFTPVIEGKRATVRTNFLTTFFPFTWANLNVNVNVLSEGGVSEYVPQVDIVGSYGRIIGLDLADKFMTDDSTDSFKPPTMSDYNIGFLLTKAVSRETRIYAGFQYSVVGLNIKFPDTIELTEDATLSELNVSRKDYILVTGITNLVREDKRMVAYLGYGFAYKKIFSRFAWHHDHLELGFNIYPEGLLVVHPYMGWHWNF